MQGRHAARVAVTLFALVAAACTGSWLGGLAEDIAPPPSRPRILLFVPHLGATDLEDCLRRGDLPAGGLRSLALRQGAVCRRVTVPAPATTTAALATLVSGRLPLQTGATMAHVPDPHRRHAASLPGLSFALLGRSFLRDSAGDHTRSLLAAGLPWELLPADAELWRVHRHGASTLHRVELARGRDAANDGWILPPAVAPGVRAVDFALHVEGGEGRRRDRVLSLLATRPLPLLCRHRDGVAGRLPRAGRGWRLGLPVACGDSALYFETADALVTLEEGELRVSPFTHPDTWPPLLAARLGPPPVRSLPAGTGRWEDAEILDVLLAALDRAGHRRLVACLHGPSADAGVDALDTLLGVFARAVAERGGVLVVIGLTGGHPLRQSVDLREELRRHLPAGLAHVVTVRADEGHARIEVRNPSRARLAAITDALRSVLPPATRVHCEERGVCLVDAPPGTTLDGSAPLLVAGRPDDDPAMAGTVFAHGPGVPRSATPQTSGLELSWRLARWWSREDDDPAFELLPGE